MAKLTEALFTWSKHRREQELLHRFGGIQTCPWCRQVAQSEPGWNFQAWDQEPMLNRLTCGVCGGTSIWLWGMGMHFMASLDPPKPAWPDAHPIAGRAALREGGENG